MIHDQKGQSLIETIGAIFILTMALTTGLGLAVYAFSRSAVSQNEIIATNLAREGIDVVRMMRDSNWLAADAGATGSRDLQNCPDISKNCYPRAFNPSNNYDIAVDPTQIYNMRAVFDPAAGSWSLNSTASYNLYLQADGTYTHTATGGSNFARMINISSNTAAPYTNQNSNWELIIKSVVAWRGKGCTVFDTSQDLLALATPCKVVTEEHLTNWKDYK